MAKFEVPIVKIRAIEAIEGSDFIELAVVGEYRCVVGKGQFKAGSLAAYIPEGSIVPAWLLAKLGLTGKLDGTNKDRVKARKFRGTLSQGLVYGVVKNPRGTTTYAIEDEQGDAIAVLEDMDVSGALGVTKYEPVIPASMAGEVCNIGTQNTVKYDFDNFKKYPDVLIEGEDVIMTEKIHGTYMCIGVVPGLDHQNLLDGCILVGSKGLSAQGLVFQFNANNERNVYLRTFNSLTGEKTIGHRMMDLMGTTPFYIMGEVFGAGVQDLQYGMKNISFRAFDAYLGTPNAGRFLDVDEKIEVFQKLNVDMVPILYRGPFSKALADFHRDGKTVAGNGANIREGIVITPVKERFDNTIGRVILKHISDDYLLRKNATEFN